MGCDVVVSEHGEACILAHGCYCKALLTYTMSFEFDIDVELLEERRRCTNFFFSGSEKR